MFERPFGQTNEQTKKAEEFLANSSLKIEEEDKGQFYHPKSPEKSEIKDIDSVYEVSDKAKSIVEDKVNNSVFRNARLEDME